MKDNTIQLNLFSLLSYDMVALIFSCIPGFIAWDIGILYIHHVWQTQTKMIFILILLTPFIVYITFISIIFVIRVLIPKLVPGVYTAGFNRGVLSWYLHFALGRAANLAFLTLFIQLFFCTKYLYWRALGAKISYKVNTSIDVQFTDLSLISIGPNAIIGAGVMINCHAWVGNKLILAPVKIGENVFIGAATRISVNSDIRNNVFIGYNNFIYDNTILENTKIDNFAWQFGKPKT